jgi:hypothetical protein
MGRPRCLRYTVPYLLAVRQGPAFHRPDQAGETRRSRSMLERSSRLPGQALHVPTTRGFANASAEEELEDDR